MQKAFAVAKIEHPEVMDETGQRQKVGGLMDPKMGSMLKPLFPPALRFLEFLSQPN